MGTDRWAGLAELRDRPFEYLIDRDGTAWAELELHETEDAFDEASGEWLMPATCRYRRAGGVTETRFPSRRPAALAAAAGADEPWFPAGTQPALPKADPGTGRVINGLLAGQSLWDVEWHLDERLLPPDADFATRLLAAPNHPFTRVLGRTPEEALAYARGYLSEHGMAPDGYVLEARPSSKDL